MTWAPVPGYPGYEVSDQGQVRSSKKGKRRILRPIPSSPRSHTRVHLMKGGLPKHEFIHRLVLLAFVGPCPKGMQARHFPRRSGNRLENLSWATPLVNQRDRDTHGTHNKGRRNHAVKLTAQNVRSIRRVKIWPYGTVAKLARKYGVSSTVIQCVRDMKGWRHI